MTTQIKAYIAEHGLVRTVETLLASPATFDMTESHAAQRVRIITQIIDAPWEVIDSISGVAACFERIDSTNSDRDTDSFPE
ncbi:hypothetical protein [Neorhizobium alkalisoli]|uniref:hypothetical protein n=1 Tax=Neorhizobium alkalisoli TaxID=528178 RepID=UPI000CF8687E|nr:hypothetical protein [Neorhizobium alkalisoli]